MLNNEMVQLEDGRFVTFATYMAEIISALVSHTHSGVTAGGASTGAPSAAVVALDEPFGM